MNLSLAARFAEFKSSLISPITKILIARELRSYFSAPIGYIFVIIFLVSIGYITFEPGSGSFFLNRQANMLSFFHYLPWPLLILVPAVSMRMWAEERKSGTVEFLLTLPITLTEAVIAKFLAGWIFLSLAIALTFPMVFTVLYLGSPDLGAIFVSYLGSLLLAGTFLAIGTLFSAASKSQVVSFILTVVCCYLFLMAGSPPLLDFLSAFVPRYVIDVFESLSLLNHFESLQRGIVRLGDLAYYGVMIVGWLSGAILILNEKKSQ